MAARGRPFGSVSEFWTGPITLPPRGLYRVKKIIAGISFIVLLLVQQ